MRNPRRFRAFTLIELLTVVAIISLLISILTPSLSRARAQAKAAACGARLHDMGLSIMAYSNDFSSSLPVAQYDSGEPNGQFGWAELLAQQLYHRRPAAEPNEPFPFLYNRHNVDASMFYYFNCPYLGKEQDHTGHYRVYLPAWSYGSMPRDASHKIIGQPDPNKSSTLESVPLDLPLLGDARMRYDAAGHGELTSYIAGGQAEPGADGYAHFDDRHFGRVNLLYPDGHIDLVAYQQEYFQNLFVRLRKDWDLSPPEELPDANTP
jgi:prepilin-type N-terminal cleavage/methylation domain-containing protein